MINEPKTTALADLLKNELRAGITIEDCPVLQSPQNPQSGPAKK